MKPPFSRRSWDALAGRLLKRLDALKCESSEDSFSRAYRRDRLTDEVIHALENSGRNEEMIDLCMKEAERTGS